MERKTFFKKVGVGNLLIVLVMLVFSLFGAVFGMSEETIAFTLLLIPLAVSMGYDSITGVCMVYVAAHTGFSAAFLNPFTVGIAQNLWGCRPFQVWATVLYCWISLTVISILFVLWYANRVGGIPALGHVGTGRHIGGTAGKCSETKEIQESELLIMA
jgi:uncharacterized ion transporter superfamily protein YfcC